MTVRKAFVNHAISFLGFSEKSILLLFRLRDKVSHLVNIDGDLCQRVQNGVKKFCKPFEKHIVNLWRDIHNDIKFSADIKAALQELCLLLDLPYKKPSEAVPHLWLSAYNVTANNMPLYDALFCCTTLG